MKLSTSVNIPKSDVQINHKEGIGLMGSCFANSIGNKLAYHKFNTLENPFGIIYNPLSIAKSIEAILENKSYNHKDLIQNNAYWISLDHHGRFSSEDQKQCLDRINDSIQEAHPFLKTAKTLFITFGSAWVYEYPNFGIVANCHKIPAKKFSKRLLSVEEIYTAYVKIMEKMSLFNPNLRFIFTVSPVRHIKDGLHQNNLSKGTLHLALNELRNTHCSYFPAYELVIDELRDYRFFKEDLVHPTDMAIEYVWGKFCTTFFNEETSSLNKEIANIQAALTHRPLNENSKAHQEFLASTNLKIKHLTSQHPYLSF